MAEPERTSKPLDVLMASDQDPLVSSPVLARLGLCRRPSILLITSMLRNCIPVHVRRDCGLTSFISAADQVAAGATCHLRCVSTRSCVARLARPHPLHCRHELGLALDQVNLPRLRCSRIDEFRASRTGREVRSGRHRAEPNLLRVEEVRGPDRLSSRPSYCP